MYYDDNFFVLVCMSVCLSVCLSVPMSVSFSVCIFVWPSVFYPNICMYWNKLKDLLNWYNPSYTMRLKISVVGFCPFIGHWENKRCQIFLLIPANLYYTKYGGIFLRKVKSWNGQCTILIFMLQVLCYFPIF